MKNHIKKGVALSIGIALLLLVLVGCDPIYPWGSLRVTPVPTMSVGESVELEIIYPNTGGSAVAGWKNLCVEIVDGEEIVAVSDLTVTAIKSGTATLRITATTVIGEESSHEEKEYWTDIEICVQ